MKPRNNFERTVTKLSSQLPTLSETDENKIQEMLDEMDAQAIDQINDEFCYNKSFGIVSSPSGVMKGYYSIITTYHGNQVIRTYLLECRRKYHSQMPKTRVTEVLRRWYSPLGEKAIEARSYRPFSYSEDDWRVGSEMSIKREYKGVTYDSRFKYLQEATVKATHYIRTIGALKKFGLTKSLLHSDKILVCKSIELAFDYRGEYFLKCGHKDLFKKIAGGYSKSEQILNYFNCIKIADRHKYKVNNLDLWLDMLEQLKYLKKDLNNPFYICPEDIKEAHDRWTKKANQVREAEREKQKLQDAIKHEAEYKESHGKFFNICFATEDKELNFHVISSVDEMVKEGIAMHHCVGGYWCYKNSLIIACRGEEDKRIATIEVNITNLSIVQIRGVQNSKPEQYDDIYACIMQHIRLIKDARDGKKRKKEKLLAA